MDERDAKRIENFRRRLEEDDPFVHGFSSEVGRQLLDIIDRMKAKIFRMGVILGDLKIENTSLKKQLTNSIPIVARRKGEPTHIDETDWRV